VADYCILSCFVSMLVGALVESKPSLLAFGNKIAVDLVLDKYLYPAELHYATRNWAHMPFQRGCKCTHSSILVKSNAPK
jgi:hypothetical protein